MYECLTLHNVSGDERMNMDHWRSDIDRVKQNNSCKQPSHCHLAVFCANRLSTSKFRSLIVFCLSASAALLGTGS